ncbi:MAG: hypothetical protein KF901_22490 [Myxococcales bacterium]|nr:hypothetical protein [Myxococcales bacterium]
MRRLERAGSFDELLQRDLDEGARGTGEHSVGERCLKMLDDVRGVADRRQHHRVASSGEEHRDGGGHDAGIVVAERCVPFVERRARAEDRDGSWGRKQGALDGVRVDRHERERAIFGQRSVVSNEQRRGLLPGQARGLQRRAESTLVDAMSTHVNTSQPRPYGRRTPYRIVDDSETTMVLTDE